MTLSSLVNQPPAKNFPSLEPNDLRPICVRILHNDDLNKDILNYDAEWYEGPNDSDISYSTDLINSHQDFDNITVWTNEISSYTNMIFQKSSQSMFPIQDLHQSIYEVKILRMRLNFDNPQMDSGANKNVTNDKSIIRKYIDINPIPIYGVDHHTAACHITG